MKLTAEQIDQLYAFTIKHYVEYYDLQTELVDHLANAIEQQWQENPKLSFEEALNIEFKKFGVFGFSGLVEQRRKALSKKYFKLIWFHFRKFFKWPKILGSFTAIVVLEEIFRNISFVIPIEVYLMIRFIILSYCVYYLYKIFKRKNKEEKENKKRWMFKEMLYSLKNSALLILIPFNSLPFFTEDANQWITDPFYSWLISFLLVCYCLFVFIVMRVIPSKAEQYLKETYPEYEISK